MIAEGKAFPTKSPVNKDIVTNAMTVWSRTRQRSEGPRYLARAQKTAVLVFQSSPQAKLRTTSLVWHSLTQAFPTSSPWRQETGRRVLAHKAIRQTTG